MAEGLQQQLQQAQNEIERLSAAADTFKETRDNLQDEIKKLEEAAKNQISTSDKKTVYVTRERKITKFFGRPRTDSDQDVEDWITDIKQYITDLEDSQKVDTILSHLAGEAKDEVKLLEDEDKDTAEKILNFLQKTFKSVDSIVKLTQQLSNRVQKDDESVQSYSLSLLKLQNKINRKEKGVAPDEMVKSRFLEGIQNEALKRDLKKLAKVDSTLTFPAFRKLVLTEIQDDTAAQPKTIKTKSAETKTVLTTEQQLIKQMEMMNKTMQNMQQQQLEMMSKVIGAVQRPTFNQNKSRFNSSQKEYGGDKKPDNQLTSSRPEGSSTGRRMKGPCYYCGKLGHVISECWKKKNRNKTNSGPTQSVVQTQSTEVQTQQGN